MEGSRKKVLFVDFGPGFGGSVVNLARIISHAEALGIEPHVIIDHCDPESLGLLSSYTTNVRYLRHVKAGVCFQRNDLRFIRRGMAFLNIFFRGIINIPFYFKVVRYANKASIDIIQFNNVVGLDEIIIALILRRVTVCHAQHGFQSSALLRFFLGRINHFVSISNYVKRDLLTAGVPEQKITLIYNSVDLAEIKRLSEEECNVRVACNGYNVGLFGALLAWKGHHVLIDAVEILVHQRKVNNICFFFVGSSPGDDDAYEQSLRQRVLQLGLEKNIKFIGYIKNIYPVMKKMDVVVHTSIEPEPFGLVLIEAMALGRPVIATNQGGPTEIVVHHKNGILVSPSDAKSLVEALLNVFSDEESRFRMGREGVRTVEEKFNMDLFKNAFKQLYLSIATGAK